MVAGNQVQVINASSERINPPISTCINSPKKSIKSITSSSKVKSSKKSETAKSNTARFKLPCFQKIVELNFMRLVSLLGISTAIIGVVIIAIITIYTFAKTSFPVFRTLKIFGDSAFQYNKMSSAVNLVVLSKDLSKYSLFNRSRNEMIDSFNELFKLLPESAEKVFPNSSKDASTLYLFPLQDAILKQTLAGNYSEGVKLFMKPEHFSGQSSFLNDYFLFVEQIRNISNTQHELIASNSTTYLIVVLICLVISLPIGVAIFVSVLRMERVSRKKLMKAKRLQLQNVMSSVVQRSLLKQWISLQNYGDSSNDLNRIFLLEDIQDFKSPEKQEIQTMRNFLEELKDYSEDSSIVEQDTVSESSDAYSINTTTSIASNRKIDSLMIHLYEKYLNPRGSPNYVKTKGYAKVENFIKEQAQNEAQVVPLTLFDEIQKEVSENLIPAFERYQLTISKESNRNSPRSGNSMAENKVLKDFRNEFKDFLKNYEKAVLKSINSKQ
ncbi:predicted protein [Naegleria gruberi]|uniref:Predicted protein n=1 Tax=Naegleria gruberi TaxID=5762 RepID=D2VLF5_NAEGR|nr:uncharacterized protein NAEGRDRAFT_69761 [Naegleria gruberi]EFC42377.1 predicted protein [Naegleria gruberi]|eukprot:XP_002675121.1 predicted protein [Naegleria gruberi strain NEG-M]